MSEKPSSGLTAIEIAAITAGVPMSGNPKVDAIISVALRLRTATLIAQGLVSTGNYLDNKALAERAVEKADALLAQFEGKKS